MCVLAPRGRPADVRAILPDSTASGKSSIASLVALFCDVDRAAVSPSSRPDSCLPQGEDGVSLIPESAGPVKAYIDSDILIWHLRGESRARDLLRTLRAEHAGELCVGALQRAGIVFFARDSELADTRLPLSLFETIPVDSAVVDLGAKIHRHSMIRAAPCRLEYTR